MSKGGSSDFCDRFVLYEEESRARLRADSGADRHLFNDWRGRETTPNPASISQIEYPSSTLQGGETSAKLDFHYPSDYYNHPNSRSDDYQLSHAGESFTGVPGIEGASPYLPSVHQGQPEFGRLSAGSSQSTPSFDGRDPSPMEGSIPPPLGLPFDPIPCASVLQPPTYLNLRFGFYYDLSSSQTVALPHTPSVETNVTEVAAGKSSPLPVDHPPIPTHLSSFSGGFGDQNSSPTPVAIRGTTEDSPMTASLGKMVMDPSRPLSDPAPGLRTSGAHLPNSDDVSPLGANFTHGEATLPDFRLDHNGHQLATTGGLTPPPSRSLADRDRKKKHSAWCQPCKLDFSQERGLIRHNKDVHSPRNLCPYCPDFKWSPGRRYILTAHIEKSHQDVAPCVPKFH